MKIKLILDIILTIALLITVFLKGEIDFIAVFVIVILIRGICFDIIDQKKSKPAVDKTQKENKKIKIILDAICITMLLITVFLKGKIDFVAVFATALLISATCFDVIGFRKNR